MALFNSEWIWLKPSSSPSCKLGAHGQAPLSFLLPRKTQGKPKDNPILRNTGFIISRCCVHHPETMEDKDAPPFFPLLPRKDTHTHTHTHTHVWIPMSFQTIAKGYLLDTDLPPASSDLQRWPFVSRIFLLSRFLLPRWFLFADIQTGRFSPHGLGVVVMKMMTTTTR